MHLWIIGSGLLRTHTIMNVVSLQNSKIPSMMQALVSHVLWSVCGIFNVFCSRLRQCFYPRIVVAKILLCKLSDFPLSSILQSLGIFKKTSGFVKRYHSQIFLGQTQWRLRFEAATAKDKWIVHVEKQRVKFSPFQLQRQNCNFCLWILRQLLYASTCHLEIQEC